MSKSKFIKNVRLVVQNMTDQPLVIQPQVRCWDCQYCDKESAFKNNDWVLTRTGYCLAEKSAVNGENGFYRKVYIDTTYSECGQFEFHN